MANRSGFVSALLGLCLGAAPACGTASAANDSGWWVVLGSAPAPNNIFSPQTDAAVRAVEAAARRCGLAPFQDFSSKFRGFTPGYAVVVDGAYASRASAGQVLAKPKGCIPGAYVKQGAYAGE